MVKNIKYSNGSLFVLFNDDEFIMQECDKDTALQIFNLAQEGADKNTIYAILDPKFQQLIEEVETIKKDNQLALELVENVTSDERFYFKDNKLYRQDIPLAIPKVLAQKIQDCITSKDTEELNRLDKFWARCVRIRNSQAREQFYDYIVKNELLITDQGAVLGFRRANLISNEQPFVKFVTQEYFRLRKNKKSTNVDVFESNGTYNLKEGNNVGNLKDLYAGLSTSTSYFESWHKSTFHYQPEKFWIGKETRLPINECNTDPNVACGAGLHFGGKNFSMSGYGDTPIVFVFDPSRLLACPDNYSTGRCQGQVFLSVLDKDREFEVTSEIQKAIDEIVGQFDLELDQFNAEEFKDHTLVKELPNIDYKNLFGVIKEVVNPSIVKERLVKL